MTCNVTVTFTLMAYGMSACWYAPVFLNVSVLISNIANSGSFIIKLLEGVHKLFFLIYFALHCIAFKSVKGS